MLFVYAVLARCRRCLLLSHTDTVVVWWICRCQLWTVLLLLIICFLFLFDWRVFVIDHFEPCLPDAAPLFPHVVVPLPWTAQSYLPAFAPAATVIGVEPAHDLNLLAASSIVGGLY